MIANPLMLAEFAARKVAKEFNASAGSRNIYYAGQSPHADDTIVIVGGHSLIDVGSQGTGAFRTPRRMTQNGDTQIIE
eukprot:scaffold41124_cov32-Tisochrysis_lutea.AAC.1